MTFDPIIWFGQHRVNFVNETIHGNILMSLPEELVNLSNALRLASAGARITPSRFQALPR